MSRLLEDHYRTFVDDRGYESPEFAVGGYPAAAVEHRFAFGDGARQFASRLAEGVPSLVTVGISTTGPPHPGTLGQLLTAIHLQNAGLDVQLVIADLAAYNGAGVSFETARSLAEKYRSFALALGFDADAGFLRVQSETTGVLRTSHLLSRYFDPERGGSDDESTDFETALEDAYDADGVEREGTTEFASQQTALLLASDTVYPILSDGYENVLFVGGADNHGLAAFVSRTLEETPYEGTVGGLYTKLVRGLEDYPKMSKSIPDSRFTLDADPPALRRHIRNLDDDADAPEQSTVYQLMAVASEYSPEELEQFAEHYREGGEEWADAKRAYADYLVEVASEWR